MALVIIGYLYLFVFNGMAFMVESWNEVHALLTQKKDIIVVHKNVIGSEYLRICVATKHFCLSTKL